MYEKDLSHVIQTGSGVTEFYAAPEVSLGTKAITLKCDVFSYGLMLFEILQRRIVGKDGRFKFWENMKNGRLEKMILDCGIEQKDLEEAERLCVVGLWCVQFHPDNRPKMSDVVKVLEGVMQFSSPPPNPDPYAGAIETPSRLMSSSKSDNYDERSDDVDEEESRITKKYASMNLNEINKPNGNIKPHTKVLKIPFTSGEAIPSIQYELQRRFNQICGTKGVK